MTLVAVEGLTVAYTGNRAAPDALRGVSLRIGAGERVALIGESGSGKTTLALALAGLLPGDAAISGTIAWPGLDRRPRNGLDIGFVFQDAGASLDPMMRVGLQVAEVVRAHGSASRREAQAHTVRLLSRVGLAEPASIAEAFPHQLSGGQKQRVAIAAAIAASPRLLIADEPTSALDTIVQAGIVRLLRDLAEVDGMALLLITHDIALAAGISDRIVVLKDGAIVESSGTADLLAKPQHPYTASLIEATLVLDDPSALDAASNGAET